jgi:hypothetical protein
MSGEDWIGDHLLGEETESDAAEARRRLEQDPALAERVARLADVAGRLEAMSPAAWEVAGELGADERSGADERTGAAEPAHAPAARRPRFGLPALATVLAVVALAVGVGIGALIWSGGGGSGGGRTVALRPLPGTAAAATGSARVTGAGVMTLRVSQLPAAGRGRYYEAWLMTNTRRLVPVASFEVTGSGGASVTVPLPAPVTSYRYVDVSRQAVSGGTAHSGDSVLRGPTGG